VDERVSGESMDGVFVIQRIPTYLEAYLDTTSFSRDGHNL